MLVRDECRSVGTFMAHSASSALVPAVTAVVPAITEVAGMWSLLVPKVEQMGHEEICKQELVHTFMPEAVLWCAICRS
jgi:hypothetical protein